MSRILYFEQYLPLYLYSSSIDYRQQVFIWKQWSLIVLDLLTCNANGSFPPVYYHWNVLFCLFNQVKLSEKLSHVQSLCIHEMIVRAFKHILQAVIAAAAETGEMAISIAAALSLMLGVPESGESVCCSNVHSLIWRWLEVFLLKRYQWEFSKANYRDIRKYAILRGLCHKVMDVDLTI